MNLRSLHLSLIALFIAVSASFAQSTKSPTPKDAATEATVWGGLVLAKDNKAEVPEPVGPFAELVPRLEKIFEDKSFELLGEHNQDVFKEYESWVVPSKELFLKLDSKGPAKGGGTRLHLQVWQDENVLVKGDATLLPDSPLVIAGPRWGDGQLIFVILLK